ncbi:hypothetical protein HUE58_05900 [Candidatus Ruthia endofausta]|uniref:Uncharacterized protein n=1 Tax=Candidatus Ruthia endofausta TaxID=2738852 RepID=A0A6N0HQU0_9GAMM|nr:hypothetical protein [Candidatus Ruthia endofausta]QKQ24628.1 hypothetical protein HUE58_05900 [Candidatus Ruthia endofausta]
MTARVVQKSIVLFGYPMEEVAIEDRQTLQDDIIHTFNFNVDGYRVKRFALICLRTYFVVNSRFGLFWSNR